MPSTSTAPGGDDAQDVRAATDDELLVQRLLERDEAAFEELIDRYHGPLVRLALVFVRDRAVAEEVVQDTWVGVLNGLGSFEGRSSLKTWILYWVGLAASVIVVVVVSRVARRALTKELGVTSSVVVS
jgi:hypothetical protein